MIAILIIVSVLSLVGWLIADMRKKALKLHTELDQVEKMATDAKTVGAVVKAFDELRPLSSKCVGEIFGPRHQIIYTILKTKYDIYKELENNAHNNL